MNQCLLQFYVRKRKLFLYPEEISKKVPAGIAIKITINNSSHVEGADILTEFIFRLSVVATIVAMLTTCFYYYITKFIFCFLVEGCEEPTDDDDMW